MLNQSWVAVCGMRMSMTMIGGRVEMNMRIAVAIVIVVSCALCAVLELL